MRRLLGAVVAVTFGAGLSTAGMAAASAAPATIVVGPGQSIQNAVNHASPGDTIMLKPGVYHQTVLIRTDDITLRGSGRGHGGVVLKPPRSPTRNICTAAFGETGVCILAKKVNMKTGAVKLRVHGDTVTDLSVIGFPGNGVFGYGTRGLTVTSVLAMNDGDYGISRFVSTATLFADDIAIGNKEAGFYVGDSPDAATVVRDSQAMGNQFGIFVRHARHVQVTGDRVTGNCQGILVLDDGQPGGAGDTEITRNSVSGNNKFCAKSDESPVPFQGGGILLLGATKTTVSQNSVGDNMGSQFNSGGIVILSAGPLTHGSDPNFDTVTNNWAHHNHPADLIWDGSGTGLRLQPNNCGKSLPAGLC